MSELAHSQLPKSTVRSMRLFAVLSIIGGGLHVLQPIWNRYLNYQTLRFDVISGSTDLISAIMVLLGAIAFFIYQQHAKSVNQLISYILLFIGMSLYISMKTIQTFVVPMLKYNAPNLADSPPSPASEGMMIMFMAFAISWVYFGISSMIARNLPLVGSILVTVAPFIDFIPMGNSPIEGPQVWGVGVIWLSLAVYRRVKV
ncbi:hypothetical protein [Paenibacillus aceris]|uniref:DUF4386 domain-containing protein n=1 Tax=Paenibacillus aceris TaxID=869555 RepID=A0ABS4I9G1_9BACL|nr:hypothetical protein [Paenibacillus aceris]MBP1967577.1 hypothetical protein [Paenibacillus aceris]NHW39161.1 hypothetical protein [Paenibacillus aceris]